MDRLDAMQVLITAVDEGSLSAGSRKLDAPLTSVSRKVAELERHLGTKLLIRTSRNLQLTDAGRDYVDAARAILAQIEVAERRASGEYDEPRGELTVTLPVEFGRLVALPFVTSFLNDHPEIYLDLLSVDRFVPLVEERVDVGIRLGNLADSSLYAVKVGEVSVLTCASPAYLTRRGRPCHPDDLANHDGITFNALKESLWAYESRGSRFEANPRPRVHVNNASAAATAALRDLGIVQLLNYHVANELRSGSLVRLLENYESPSIPVHLVYHRQGLMPRKVRSFLDWTVPRLRQRLKELRELGS